MRLLIAQLGARQHYQPAVMAERHNCLTRLITDIWNPMADLAARMPTLIRSKLVQKAAGRFRYDISSNKVKTLPILGFRSWQYRRRAHSKKELYEFYVSEGRAFGEACRRYMDCDYDTAFGFSSATLEVLQAAKRSGKLAVVDQIDPARFADAIVFNEERRFPAAVAQDDRIPDSYFRRLEREWAEAHLIVVNSVWTRNALIEQGCCPEKLRIVPLPYEARRVGSPRARPSTLKILWLGTVCLGKGIQYLLEAAQRLAHLPVRFTIAGDIAVRLEAFNIPDNCEIVGYVPRTLAHELYSTHDVFILPTLSDGFGLTQVEAMSYGLPVIATTSCGDVVEHGISGALVRPGESADIVAAVEFFLDNRSEFEAFSLAALKRAEAFSLDAVWPKYLDALRPSSL